MSKDTYMNYYTKLLYKLPGHNGARATNHDRASHLAQWSLEIKFALFMGRAWLP